MIEISFPLAEALLAGLWLLMRIGAWIRQGHIAPKRELALVLMYINLAVILRFTFFPMALADGRVRMGLGWQNVGTYGLYAVLTDPARAGSELRGRAEAEIRRLSEKAMAVIDMKRYVPFESESGGNTVCRCKYFESLIYDISKDAPETIIRDESRFESLVVINGTCTVSAGDSEVVLEAGECAFLNAGDSSVVLSGDCKVMLCRV